MFSRWFIKVLERMNGRNLPSMIAANSNNSITERTMRNWLGQRTTPAPQRFAEIRAGARAWLVKDLEGKGWSSELRDAFVDGMDACPGIMSGFAFSLQGGDGSYPAFLQLACKLDLLEQELDRHAEAGELQAWVQALLGTPWIRDEHLLNPDDEAGGRKQRGACCRRHVPGTS